MVEKTYTYIRWEIGCCTRTLWFFIFIHFTVSYTNFFGFHCFHNNCLHRYLFVSFFSVLLSHWKKMHQLVLYSEIKTTPCFDRRNTRSLLWNTYKTCSWCLKLQYVISFSANFLFTSRHLVLLTGTQYRITCIFFLFKSI